MNKDNIDNSEIDNYSQELWQRQTIGLHTYIPSIILSICLLYRRITL